MPDIIRLLPDAVANQIAAGEVIQRPGSVIKELLENAIDAGASDIQVFVKDAGRTLMKIVDNGCGMSTVDARMSFEKHATSKIQGASDLFQIQTKGFRGEAMPSIAAIAHVELKTRLAEEELGTHLVIEGSEVKLHESCQCQTGTSISVKNLFFNVPARRHFLKSDAVETRHIIDEFERVALAHPEVSFMLNHNNSELFTLSEGSLRHRIIQVLGKKYQERLVPVDEDIEIVNIQGFIGKPEFARKTRGEQFFFVNKRYIKSQYLNHALTSAFESLLPPGHHPLYFLYLDIKPEDIDINVHPAKTEIKFKDERAIYSVIHSSVKKSLGRFNITPSLDFEQEVSISIGPPRAGVGFKEPQIRVNPDYNPFQTTEQPKSLVGRFERDPLSTKGWQSLFEIAETHTARSAPEQVSSGIEQGQGPRALFQLHNRFIVSQIKSGMIVVNQNKAHIRVLYERYLTYLSRNCGCTQQLLFPQTIAFSESDFVLLNDRLEDIRSLGFDFEEFGPRTLKINGLPAESRTSDVQQIFDEFVDMVRNAADELVSQPQKQMALALARSLAIKPGTVLKKEEMSQLLDELFGCEVPNYCPTGNPTIATFTLDELNERFIR
jgi:DNA mismatch repair protein MutL